MAEKLKLEATELQIGDLVHDKGEWLKIQSLIRGPSTVTMFLKGRHVPIDLRIQHKMEVIRAGSGR